MGWVGLGCSEWPKPGGWWILSWHQKRWSLGLFQKVWRSDSGSNKLVIWRVVTIELTMFDLLFGLFDLLFDLLWFESWMMTYDESWWIMAHFFVASLWFGFLEGVDVLATSICLVTTLLRKTEALPLSASLHLGSYFFGVSEGVDKGRQE